MEKFKRQNHCSNCGTHDEKPTYVMLTQKGKDTVVGLCPKCLAELVSMAKPETVTTESIDINRVEKAKRR